MGVRMAPVVSSAWLPPWTDQELPVRVSKSCLSGRVMTVGWPRLVVMLLSVADRARCGRRPGRGWSAEPGRSRRGGEAAVAVGGADVGDDDAVAVVPAGDLSLGLAVLWEPAEHRDRLAVGEVVHGVDDVALGGEPLLDAVEAGQARGRGRGAPPQRGGKPVVRPQRGHGLVDARAGEELLRALGEVLHGVSHGWPRSSCRRRLRARTRSRRSGPARCSRWRRSAGRRWRTRWRRRPRGPRSGHRR